MNERHVNVDTSNPVMVEWEALCDGSNKLTMQDGWNTATSMQEVVDELLPYAISRMGSVKGNREALILLKEDVYVLFSGGSGSVHVNVAAPSVTDTDKARAIFEWLRGIFPPSQEVDDGKVNVLFWTSGSVSGPRAHPRRIVAPTWSEIAANYNSASRAQLDRLITKPAPGVGGQLILWHGIPGTGKTYAIRAMMKEWRKWCSFHYIIDPESFFGGGAEYMMNILLRDDGEVVIGDDGEETNEEKWRLLIFEDTGELLSQDAKIRVGQGLSRLLNIVDGMIGQGLKLMVLITTNEELGRLHPAVVRPGRCAANIKVDSLGMAEAEAWASTQGIVLPKAQAYTLADLYALRDGRNDVDLIRQVGFSPR